MRAFPNERLQEVAKSLEFHRAQPHISLATHVRTKMADLGNVVLPRRRVYMDQRYWILLRDAAMNRARDRIHINFLDLLRHKVDEELIVWPAGESVFLELLKQSDLATRQATAKVIDDLSLGVTIEYSLSRLKTEICHFLFAMADGNPQPGPPKHLVWTKIAHVIGTASPVFPDMSEAEMLAIQKAFDDFLWTVSLDDMLAETDAAHDEDAILRMAASRITVRSAAHASKMRNLYQVFLAEVSGFLYANRDAVSDAAEHWSRQVCNVPIGVHDREKIHQSSGNMLYNLFRYKKVGTELPVIRIVSSLYAAARWNRTRKFDSTDFYDFYHAAAALPYCDYFLTEKPLQVMLTNRPLELDKLYGTKVIHDVEDAVQQIAAV